jgi:hypothetical protein
MVGLIPLFAAETLEADIVDRLPGFKRRMQWFIDNRPAFRGHVELEAATGATGPRHLLSIVDREQLVRMLRTMLDEREFLSPHGVRALSRVHLYLLVEALQRFDHFYGDGLKVECPTGSGHLMTLAEVARELSHRLTRIFRRDASGRRPVHGADERFRSDPHWRDLVLFYEYFHGDTGRGLGASHQTGWTGLVAKLLQQSGQYEP